MLKESTIKYIGTNIVRLFSFLISICIAFISSGLVKLILRGSDPYSISNIYLESGYNPEENYIKILWIIAVTLICYFGILYLANNKPLLFKIFIAAFVVFILLSVELMPRNKSMIGNLDTFHHGEQLAPAHAFNKGKGLYSDMYVLHGAGEDVILPSIALKLAPNNGIGTYYFITITLQMLSGFLFVLLLAYIFKDISVFLVVTALFTFNNSVTYGSFYYVRDILLWLGVGLVAYIVLGKNKSRAKSYACLALGGLASLSLLFSIDRGLVMLFMCTITGLILSFTVKKNDAFVLRPPKSIHSLYQPMLVALGVLIVQLIALLSLGLSQYSDYLQTYFLDIPKYSGYMFNYPFVFKESNIFAWIPIIVLAITSFMLLLLLKNSLNKKSFSKETVFASILLVCSLFFMKAGYGRFDFGHIAYSTTLLFIASFYIILIFLKKSEMFRQEMWAPIFLVGVILFGTFNISQATKLISINLRDTARYINLPKTSNSIWVPIGITKVVDYLKEKTTPTEKIFVFTQQPIYYYLTDRDNPTRFYIPWFADAAILEKELLGSLQNNPPAVIVYSSGNGWDNVDGTSMINRTPSVDKWIKSSYPYETTIEGVTLLSRRPLTNR